MRILMVLPTVPLPADTGQRHRFAHLALHLARRHEVALACFSDSRERAELDGRGDEFSEVRVVLEPAMNRLAAWASPDPSDVSRFRSPEMSRVVAELVAKCSPDALIVGDPALTQYTLACADRVQVLDYVCEVTLQYDRLRARSRGTMRGLWKLRRAKYTAFLRRIAPVYDVCLVNSEEDRTSLLGVSPNWRRVALVPNGLDLSAYPRDLASPEPDTLVYPGSLTYEPNLDAVRYMVEDILPRIRQRVPGVRLLVTGAVPSDVVAPRAEGVCYTGYVPDVRPVIASSWVCTVPLRLGAGGTRFKVLEALALGTPLVTNAIGAEGVAITEGVDVSMAEDPETFAEKTVSILTSPEERRRFSKAGRELVEARYDWAVLGERVVDRVRELAERRRAGCAARG
jgi:glycosyltransferase involved in cell wall biosynthesis